LCKYFSKFTIIADYKTYISHKQTSVHLFFTSAGSAFCFLRHGVMMA